MRALLLALLMRVVLCDATLSGAARDVYITGITPLQGSLAGGTRQGELGKQGQRCLGGPPEADVLP